MDIQAPTNYSLPYISLQPNRITQYYQSNNPRRYNNDNNNELTQPKSTQSGRGLSTKAKKRIQSKINWLVAYSKSKRVYNDYSNKFFTFKVNFITLTLPAIQAHKDITLKSKLLNPFLAYLRKYFEFNNYVWRAECQNNGNLHFHLVSDTYVPWFVIRSAWNRQLKRLGYIDRYHQKFKSMSWADYLEFNNGVGVKDISTIYSRYQRGKKTNWKDPNTTDIHSTQKIHNIAAYLSKYLSKSNNNKASEDYYSLKNRRISGRNWGCSQSLSKCKSIIELVDSNYSNLLDYACSLRNSFVLKEDYFTFISVDFSKLSSHFKRLINNIFLTYKRKIGYVSGGIPNKKYQYAPT